MAHRLASLLVLCGCGAPPAPPLFSTPEVPPGNPLIAEVAECSGDADAVHECVVDRICNYRFEPGSGRRFHLRPVGLAPWIQVDLDDGGQVRIDLAWYGENTSNYISGLTCEAFAPPEGPEELEATAEPADDPPDLLVLPEDERTLAAARAAFAAAEDGPRVFQQALWLSRSEDPADHAVLAEALTSRPVVELLGNTTIDRGPRYRHEPVGHRWPIAQLLFALRDGGTASGLALLDALAGEPLWADESLDMPDGQIDWLILALSSNRPPSPRVLGYWRAHARPDDGYVNLTVTALVVNGSEEALSLYRRLLRDGRFDFEDRTLWLRADLAAQRNDPGVLEVAERVLRGRLPPRLERRFLEDLFGDWTEDLRPDTGLSCPDLSRVPPETALILRRIAERALGSRLRASTKAVIEAGVGRLPD